MQLLDLTLDTPEENLALDEALLEAAEAAAAPRECLRLWESPQPIVVVGRSSRLADEVNVEHCAAAGIPILRRTSGGSAIVAAPGSLMYALVLSYELRPELIAVDLAHRYVLERNLTGLAPLVPGVARRGTSDLAHGELKFSGNSMRCKRTHLLYHGTLLYDMDLALVERFLTMPPRQPDYRRGRPHAAFVANLPLSKDQLHSALIQAWDAREPGADYPRQRVGQLVAERYGLPAWHGQR